MCRIQLQIEGYLFSFYPHTQQLEPPFTNWEQYHK